PFKPETASNNPLLPADAAIARQIGAIQVGDQIRMAGLLVDYKVTRDGREIFTRHTSLTRGATGNGACESLYVTALTLVAPGDHLRASAARYCGYASVALLVGVVALWLARAPPAAWSGARPSAQPPVRPHIGIDQVLRAGGLFAVDRDLVELERSRERDLLGVRAREGGLDLGRHPRAQLLGRLGADLLEERGEQPAPDA